LNAEGDHASNDLLAGAPGNLVRLGKKVQVYGAAVPEPQGQGAPAGEIEALRKGAFANRVQYTSHRKGDRLPVWIG
jgi:hypothetical protein